MNKAENLKIAKNGGFCVPPFKVVEVSRILGLTAQIDEVLQDCKAVNAKDCSARVEKIIKDAPLFPLPIEIDCGKKYAVRSCGEDEDSQSHSFAGQYRSFLNVSGADIQKRIIDCYISQYSAHNILYRIDSGLNLVGLSMSVIVQEMIGEGLGGVAFSVSILSGADTQIMYEVAKSAQDATDGKTKTSAYVYDWYSEKEISANENEIKLNTSQKEKITAAVLALQQLFGYPVDVEFAFEKETLFILQVRQISKISFSALSEQFTTANFRDGGVSSSACNPLLWSLYEYAWDNSLKDFFVKTKAFKRKNLTKQIRLYFARPYWNVSSCKKACLKYPGFIERDYDNDLGLSIVYAGEGRRTRITPRFLTQLPFVLKGTLRVLKKNERDLEKNKITLLADYYRFCDIDLKALTPNSLQSLYKDFISEYFYKSEYNYFWQAFVNIVRLSTYRRGVSKTLTREEYFCLMSDLKNVSHLRPYAKISEYAAAIRANSAALAFWQNTPVDKITRQYHENPDDYLLKFVTEFNNEFGYHSLKELDITFPDFFENPIYAVQLIKDGLEMPFRPVGDGFEKQCKMLKQKMSKARFKKLMKQTGSIRKFLWWREEFKDISTRYYSLVRRLTLRLAEEYTKQGVIEKAEDIFFLKFADIFDFIDGKINAESMSKIISKNRIYFYSFVNFKNQNEIGFSHGIANAGPVENAVQAVQKGVGCGGGKAKGRTRVILCPQDLDAVTKGEILIAKHFDAGFFGKFGLISGIITETGGVLCHSSIVAREYNLPAIVSANGITQKIKSGDVVQIDANTGEIFFVADGESFRTTSKQYENNY